MLGDAEPTDGLCGRRKIRDSSICIGCVGVAVGGRRHEVNCDAPGLFSDGCAGEGYIDLAKEVERVAEARDNYEDAFAYAGD